MEFGNKNYYGIMCVSDVLDLDNELEFYIKDGGATTTAYLDKSDVKELIKHLQSILEENEK